MILVCIIIYSCSVLTINAQNDSLMLVSLMKVRSTMVQYYDVMNWTTNKFTPEKKLEAIKGIMMINKYFSRSYNVGSKDVVYGIFTDKGTEWLERQKLAGNTSAKYVQDIFRVIDDNPRKSSLQEDIKVVNKVYKEIGDIFIQMKQSDEYYDDTELELSRLDQAYAEYAIIQNLIKPMVKEAIDQGINPFAHPQKKDKR